MTGTMTVFMMPMMPVEPLPTSCLNVILLADRERLYRRLDGYGYRLRPKEDEGAHDSPEESASCFGNLPWFALRRDKEIPYIYRHQDDDDGTDANYELQNFIKEVHQAVAVWSTFAGIKRVDEPVIGPGGRLAKTRLGGRTCETALCLLGARKKRSAKRCNKDECNDNEISHIIVGEVHLTRARRSRAQPAG